MATIALATLVASAGSAAVAEDPPPIKSAADLTPTVLHDPAAPVAGNAKGDVTIVAFLDSNCPCCRR